MAPSGKEKRAMRVLVVECRPEGTCGLRALLSRSGIVVDTAPNGAEGIDLARHYDYDAVVVDPGLPDMDAAAFSVRMRAAGLGTPILAIAASADSRGTVRTLTSGADDVLRRPFDAEEALARLHAIVRRGRGFADPMLRIGPLEISPARREAKAAGQVVPLTGKEFSVLELLAMRRGLAISKNTIMSHLYGGMDEPEMKIVDVFVCKLRKKLDAAGCRGMVQTVWGHGYRLCDASAEAVTGADALCAA